MDRQELGWKVCDETFYEGGDRSFRVTALDTPLTVIEAEQSCQESKRGELYSARIETKLSRAFRSELCNAGNLFKTNACF